MCWVLPALKPATPRPSAHSNKNRVTCSPFDQLCARCGPLLLGFDHLILLFMLIITFSFRTLRVVSCYDFLRV